MKAMETEKFKKFAPSFFLLLLGAGFGLPFFGFPAQRACKWELPVGCSSGVKYCFFHYGMDCAADDACMGNLNAVSDKRRL